MKYDKIPQFYIGKSEYSKEKARKSIKNHILCVSESAYTAVIYTFENGDMLQFCGGKGLFRVECLKILGNTPNIRLLKMKERADMKGDFLYVYDGHEGPEKLCNLIPGDVLAQIIEYTIFCDKTQPWESYLENLCIEFGLYMDYFFMSHRGFTKISARWK